MRGRYIRLDELYDKRYVTERRREQLTDKVNKMIEYINTYTKNNKRLLKRENTGELLEMLDNFKNDIKEALYFYM